MADTGKIVALIKALAPGVDPSVIEQAVTDWLDDHPEATTTVEDGSITEEKLASDVLADLAEIEELKEAIASVTDAAFIDSEKTASASATGWRLNESDGLCASNSSYKMDKYTVTAGQAIKVVSDDRFQFQNSASVHASAPNNRVGDRTYGAGTFTLTVPAGATYLIVSTLKTGSTAKVYDPVKIKDAISVDEFDGKISVADLFTDTKLIKRIGSIEIGASKNNQGSATYIYNNIAEFDCEEGQAIGVIINSITNEVSASPATITYKNSGGTTITTLYLSKEKFIRGSMFIAPANTKKAIVTLYPSTTGGLTNVSAKYENVLVFLASVSDIRMKPFFSGEPFPVPDYYFAGNYIKDKIATIRTTMDAADGNFDGFVFCTDIHWSMNAKKSPNLINYITKRIPIPRLFIGGDIDDGINVDAIRKYREAFSGNLYMVAGNHEYMNALIMDDHRDTTVSVTDGTIWTFYNQGMTDAVAGDVGRNYYYVDNVSQKMRYIVLTDFSDNGYVFDSDQKTWFASVLSSMPSGYTAVVFIHTISLIDHETGELTGGDAYMDVSNIVDSYNGDGEVACVVAGHRHFDAVGATPGGVPIFITACDKAIPYPGDDDWLEDQRTVGTITEQAFDVFVVNKKTKTVTAIRIGCKADNPAGSPLETRSASYDLT